MAQANQHTNDAHQVRSRALKVALAANAALVVAEVAGGIAFGSLALLADAGHMLSDVVALTIALVAHRLTLAPASARLTYGFQRTEVLGALANGVTLVAVALWIFFEAARRLGETHEVSGGGVIAIAMLGLVVNATSALLLSRAGGRSLNMRGAWLHMTADAAGSVAAIVAGVAVVVWNALWADPLVSMAIALLVLWSSWGLLRSTAYVLLEGTPQGMDSVKIERALSEDPSVSAVHHLHLWSLASDVPALSAHVVLAGEVSLHEAQLRGERLKAMLDERFGVAHVTLELECHECDPSLEVTEPHRVGH
jgi:cobalt-zinc-cadmium efflux system protein